MSTKDHWESVYGAKGAQEVSWYAAHLLRSLGYIARFAPDRSVSVIDVGGGESTLVDDLVDAGYSRITVLDISAKALEVTRERLGARGRSVTWIAANALDTELPEGAFDVWHDRAVFHFLTDAKDRRTYVLQALRALKPGGLAIVGAFGPLGPEKCSGLRVERYSAERLHDEFGDRFELLDSARETHVTPWGANQEFVYCLCRKI